MIEPKFKIGDLVRFHGVLETAYLMVTDVENFSREVDGRIVLDIDYEIVQLYPITKKFEYAIVMQDSLGLLATPNMKIHKSILNFVRKERAFAGYYDEHDLAKRFREGSSHKHEGVGSLGNPDKYKLQEKKIIKYDDVVKYKEIETIDGCLDAYNDLTSLHSNFGDEAFLQLRSLVEERIKELLQE